MAQRRGNRVLLYIVLGLLILGLAGWGTGGLGGRVTAAGTVDGLEIPLQAYADELNAQMQAFGEQTGQALTVEQAQVLGLDRQVLAGLVTRRVLDAEAAALGLSAGDARVARQVRAQRGFQGIDGTFDRDAYREALANANLSEAEFETGLREAAARSLLLAAVTGGVPAPAALGEALAAFNNERRDATWALVDAEGLAASLAPPTEAELRAFHEENPDLFTAPETRRVSYAALTPEALGGGLAVDDAAVRALYDERIAEFVQEERRLVERLVFPSDEAAAEARARLDAGEATFEALVEERGLQLADIDLGDVARGDLGAAGEAVFGTGVAEVAGPLPSDLGPALYRVNAVLAADETSFEEAAPSLRAELQAEEARRLIGGLLPEVEDLLAGGATVADVAERTDLEPGTVELSEGVTDGIAAYQAFRDAAAAAEPGAFPEIVELEDGGLAVLQVEEVAPPVVRPFEEARADVEAAWRERRLSEAALAEAETKADAIADGASFEEQGLTPRTEAGLTRRAFAEGAPEGFTEAVFAMAPGAARALPTDGGAAVVRLDRAVGPAPDDAGLLAEGAAVAEQARAALQQDLFDAYARALQADAEVRIDDAAVAAVTAQMR